MIENSEQLPHVWTVRDFEESARMEDGHELVLQDFIGPTVQVLKEEGEEQPARDLLGSVKNISCALEESYPWGTQDAVYFVQIDGEQFVTWSNANALVQEHSDGVGRSPEGGFNGSVVQVKFEGGGETLIRHLHESMDQVLFEAGTQPFTCNNEVSTVQMGIEGAVCPPIVEFEDADFQLKDKDGNGPCAGNAQNSDVQVKIEEQEESLILDPEDSVVQVKAEEGGELLALQDSVGLVQCDAWERVPPWGIASSENHMKIDEGETLTRALQDSMGLAQCGVWEQTPPWGVVPSVVREKVGEGLRPSEKKLHDSIVQVNYAEGDGPFYILMDPMVQFVNEVEEASNNDLSESVSQLDCDLRGTIDQGEEQPFSESPLYEAKEGTAEHSGGDLEGIVTLQSLSSEIEPKNKSTKNVHQQLTQLGTVQKAAEPCFNKDIRSVNVLELCGSEGSWQGVTLPQSSPCGREDQISGLLGDDQDCKQQNCPECGKSFQTSSSLSLHQRSHARERTYTCTLCGNVFRRRSALYLHRRTHTLQEQYKCTRCGQSFSRGVSLYRHMRDNEQCAIPQRTIQTHVEHTLAESLMGFDNQSMENTHQTTYPREKAYSASQSGEDMHSPIVCATSESSQQITELLVCGKCGQNFSHFQNAPIIPQANTVTPENCPGCEAKLNLKSNQRKPKEKKLYECDDCGKTFRAESQLRRHKLCLIHEKEKLFTCGECGQGFSRPTHLTSHQLTHAGDNPYLCSDCGQSFRDISSFITHHKLHQKRPLGKLPHTCSKCWASFAFPSRLKAHVCRQQKARPEQAPQKQAPQKHAEIAEYKRIQVDMKPLLNQQVCSNCGRTFIQPPDVNRLTREGISSICGDCEVSFSSKSIMQPTPKELKLYNCEECGRDFRSQTQLKKHQQSLIHVKEKLFTCMECGQGFSRPSHLTAHQLTHAGDSPYLCSECGQTFKDTSSFIAHQKSHTAQDLYICDACGKCFTDLLTLNLHQQIEQRLIDTSELRGLQGF
ncbi:zinc finger protein 585A-like [Ambystoma mexicanum]|uniref:zinc finger protein 585A-like n=1 Tax=Ambystoma mexicanum TaxID=8296 RepID=UPI0037E731B9